MDNGQINVITCWSHVPTSLKNRSVDLDPDLYPTEKHYLRIDIIVRIIYSLHTITLQNRSRAALRDLRSVLDTCQVPSSSWQFYQLGFLNITTFNKV